ncbi:hypothetical protein C0993_011963 [Termitomyces sp. T159_Od127]|nr:hypothetical protein C0993_011963 [Termitomyces sp. T159_Od127]
MITCDSDRHTATEFDSKAAKVIWDMEGIYVTSRHIRGVRFAGISLSGIVGTTPSAELLAKWNELESALIAQHPDAVPPVAYAPNPQGKYIGQDIPEYWRTKIAKEGARTLPGREHGSNCDVRFVVLPSKYGLRLDYRRKKSFEVS